jgi:hypothetical protein
MATLSRERSKGRVLVVDPNDQIAVNPRTPNGTPPEELMRPSVSLTVYRRRGALISVDANGRFSYEANEEVLRVNMLDFDPVKKAYTERYLDDITGVAKRETVGGFGIRSISIKLGANYVPEVSITFLDLYGGSLFREGSKSPLSVIYDYPPPLFKLRIKGVYGKYVEYDLHPVRENNRYGGGVINSPEITVNFVGQYYGPMTDVLLGYLKAVPYLRGEGIAGAGVLNTNGTNTPPKSFFDLVQRGKLLYTVLDNFKNNSGSIQNRDAYFELAADVDNLRRDLKEATKPANLEGKLLDELRGQDRELLGASIRINPSDEAPKPNQLTVWVGPGKLAAYDALHGEGSGLKVLYEALDHTLFDDLAAEHTTLGEQTPEPLKLDWKAQPPTKLYSKTVHQTTGGPYVVVYDFTALQNKLTQVYSQGSTAFTEAQQQVDSSTNEAVNLTIGARPTIGSVMKLVCDDMDELLERIRQAGVDPKPDPNRREAQGARAVGKLAWPTVYEQRPFRTSPEKSQEVMRYPGLYQGFADWPEVQLVESYCRAVVRAAEDAQAIDTLRNNIDPKQYVPISALEAIGQVTNKLVVNPYFGVGSIYELTHIMISRYLFCQDYAYAHVFHLAPSITGGSVDQVDGQAYGLLDVNFAFRVSKAPKYRQELIERIARLDARNAARALTGDQRLSAAIEGLAQTPAQMVARQRSSTAKPPGEAPELEAQASIGYLSDKDDKESSTLGFGANEVLITRGLGEYRYDSFRGITAIITPESSIGRTLTQQRGATLSSVPGAAQVDVLDEENAAFLRGLGATWFGGDSEAADVTAANLLRYPDKRAAAPPSLNVVGDVSSDFFVHSRREFLGNETGFMEELARAIQELTATGPLPGTELASLWRILARMQENGCSFGYIYQTDPGGLDGYNTDFFQRFFYPGAIEMPTWYVAFLAFYSLGQAYVPATNTFTAWPRRRAPLAPYDAETVRAFAAKLVSDGALTELLTTYAEVKQRAGADVKTVVSQLVGEQNWLQWVRPVHVINTTTHTFVREEDNLHLGTDGSEKGGFRSLHVTDNGVRKLRHPFEVYATTFWQELRNQLRASQKTTREQRRVARAPLNDPDFKTQIYYSFQELYERWLAGTQKRSIKTYESFKFITRSYQDISEECVVDFHNLLDDALDPEVSVFTSFSKLLQTNNFLFFPLHSFEDFGTAGDADKMAGVYWGGNFGIVDHLGSDTVAKPAFVCMLIGSYSSKPDNPDNDDYPDDGFTFGGDNQPVDFTESAQGGPVVAFRVRSGLQNQSVFDEPQINSGEFKNTDVSLKLQDDVINQQAAGTYRVRKSQNLLNVYKGRSYVCSVAVPLGNMCVQPTQYFNLEGVNLYGGAYIVHEVTHEYTAEAQQLLTNFKGYRLGKYVFGVVSDPLLDYLGSGGDSPYAGIGGVDQGVGVAAGGPSSLPGLAQQFGIPLPVAQAIIEIETAGNPAFGANKKCIARFEPGHFLAATGQLIGAEYIRDEAGVIKRKKSGRPLLRETCHKSQATEYAAIEAAAALDLPGGKNARTEAYKASSWGLMQIMGANHRIIKYESVEAMVDAFQTTEQAQLRGGLDFIKANPLAYAAARKTPPDFREFARQYNGGNYIRYNYDVRLQAAYQRYLNQANLVSGAGSQILMLRREERLVDRTLGVLQHQGEHVCYILEDTVRPTGQFVPGQTAITPGLYELAINLSPKFGREVVYLKGVPHHQDGAVRIHIGGSPDQSLGCLLVGYEKNGTTHELHRQREAEDAVTALVRGMLRAGKAYINIS